MMLTKVSFAVALWTVALAQAPPGSPSPAAIGYAYQQTASVEISERAITASIPCTDTTSSMSLNLTTRTSTTTLPPSTMTVTLVQDNTTTGSNISTPAPSISSISTSASCITNSTTSSAFVAPASIPANISTSIVIPASTAGNTSTTSVTVAQVPPLPTLNVTYAFNTNRTSTSANIVMASASVTATNYPGYNVFNLTNAAPGLGLGKDHMLNMSGLLCLVVTILLLSQII